MPLVTGTLSTVTGQAMLVAFKKRISSRGGKVEGEQLQALVIDSMAVISSNSATAVSDAATELVNNPQRPAVFGV
jgi:hypothetical protein